MDSSQISKRHGLGGTHDGGQTYAQKMTIVVLSVIFCFTTSGIIFGISAMNDVLLSYEGAFSSYCKEQLPPCQAQLDQVALATTTALTAVALVFLPLGAFLDHFGPRITVCLASVVFAAGCLALAFAKAVSDSLYFVGFFCLAVGGPPIFMSVTNFSELFPASKDAIIATQVGAFQVSSIFMVFIQLAVTQLGLSFRAIFLFYMIVPVIIFVCSLLLFPDQSLGTQGGTSDHQGEPHRLWHLRRSLAASSNAAAGDVESARASAGGGNGGADSSSSLQAPLLSPAAAGSIGGSRQLAPPAAAGLYNVSFWRQVSSGPFLAVSLVIAFFILALNYFITTVSQQMYQDALAHGLRGQQALATGAAYASTFNLVLSAAAMVGVPISGVVLLKKGIAVGFTGVGAVFLVFITVATFAQWLPLPFQVVGFAFFAFNRPCIFGAFSAYMADVFGFANFGKLYGLAQLGGAIVTPLQFLFVLLVENYLGGSYFWVNFSFFLAAVVFLLSFPYYVTTRVFSGFYVKPPPRPIAAI
eukprot:jgi/Mesen1/4208/ME000219S03330